MVVIFLGYLNIIEIKLINKFMYCSDLIYGNINSILKCFKKRLSFIEIEVLWIFIVWIGC